MPTFRSMGDFNAELTKLQREIGGDGARKIGRAMGDEAQKIAKRTASGDLGGDPMMSGWPIARLDTKVVSLEPGRVLLTPASRIAAAGWTVATLGRNQGNASGFSGPGINRTTGVTARTKTGGLRKVRATQAKRWNGTTQPKHTADKAQAAMGRAMPTVVNREYVKVLQRFFDVG